MQEPQPLGRHFLDQEIDAGRVAARPGEAGDKTKPDRVLADAEDDRDRRCCRFGRERGRVADRGDDGHLLANEIGQQRRQAIVLALQPGILDRHVLAFDVAALVEAFSERGHITRRRSLRYERDHRQRRLLRARRERPSRHAAEEGDEFPPPHGASPSAETPGDLKAITFGAAPVVHHSKIGGRCLSWVNC